MRLFTFAGAVLFATLPATSNYQLNSYGFGSGGTANSTTSTYALEGTTGELSGQSTGTVNATTKPGFIQTEQANVPKITVDNDGGLDYNKLHFVVQPDSHDPTDAKYLIAVTATATSNMNTASGIQYVQPDGTLSGTKSLTDYQTYSTWGSGTGSYIVGLTPSTTYYVAVRATQGKFTESAYGPVVSQATAAASITFSLVTSSQPSPPFSIDFGSLIAGSVATAPQTINTSLSTNGASGGQVYVSGQYGGLKSNSTGDLINAISNDLSTVSKGFGARNSSVSQSSGGPYSVLSPYNGAGNNVGIIDGTIRGLYSSSTPVTSGNGILQLKAKANSTDIAATDYQEVLTFIATANF